MNQKYEISEIAHPQYPRLHRIRALSDVRPGVPKGHLGGYVQCEENLSQKGACWIADDAVVCDNARVYGSAWIGNESHISGQAVISGDTHVGGEYGGIGKRTCDIRPCCRASCDTWRCRNQKGPKNTQIASNFGKRTDIWYCGWQCIRIRRECCRKRRKD